MIESSSHISVQGQGALNIVPDTMRLEICVNVYFNSYDEAYIQGKDNIHWVKNILTENRLRPEQGQTIEFDLSEIDQNGIGDSHFGNGEPVRLGYKLKQKIRIDIPINQELASNIVRTIGKKLPGVQIEIGFTMRDVQHVHLKLLEKAVSDAGIKAKIMAEAAGCSLGRVAKINYKMEKPNVYRHVRTIHTNEEAISNTPGALVINPADFIISDTVEVTWHLK